MIDNKTRIIIFLSLVILASAGVYAYNYLENKFYNVGFQDATTIINNQLINNLQQNGYIVYNFPYIKDNKTAIIPIKLVPEIKE